MLPWIQRFFIVRWVFRLLVCGFFFHGYNWFVVCNESLKRFLKLVTGISKKRINFRLHGFIPLDERRPGALETFAGNFLRRVKAASELIVHG